MGEWIVIMKNSALLCPSIRCFLPHCTTKTFRPLELILLIDYLSWERNSWWMTPSESKIVSERPHITELVAPSLGRGEDCPTHCDEWLTFSFHVITIDPYLIASDDFLMKFSSNLARPAFSRICFGSSDKWRRSKFFHEAVHLQNVSENIFIDLL